MLVNSISANQNVSFGSKVSILDDAAKKLQYGEKKLLVALSDAFKKDGLKDTVTLSLHEVAEKDRHWFTKAIAQENGKPMKPLYDAIEVTVNDVKQKFNMTNPWDGIAPYEPSTFIRKVFEAFGR